MAIGELGAVLRRLREAAFPPEGGCWTDGQLLERFLAHRDEAAFEALVRRHGPMVLGVCRRMLRNPHDAEDAFQATFLVLVRKAAAIRQRETVGNWLYGTAYRVALEAQAARRRARERQVSEMPEPEAPGEDVWEDLRPLLDQGLSRLPDKYRVPVVLCDLEGRTRREVARQLGIPEGTLSSRLATARRMLAKLLARYGPAVPGAALGAALSQEAVSARVPAPLVVSTVKAATAVAAGQGAAAAVASAKVTALTDGVLKAMLLAKLKVATAVLVVGGIVAGVGLLVTGILGAVAAGDVGPDLARPAAQAEEGPAAEGDGGPDKGGAPKAAPEKRFENAPGWSWYSTDPRPRLELGTSMSQADILGRGLSAFFETDKDGALRVYLAYRSNEVALRYRPVAFDYGRKRYALKGEAGTGHRDVTLARFRLDPRELPAAKAEYLGFEYLTPQGRRVVANEAAVRARKAGVEVPPFPIVGKGYDFTLTAMDGKKVRARDLRGKVVLIDCWATWCSPCMAKMSKLKELYEEHHKEGLEIVGLCFDQDAQKARKAIKRLGLGWTQVLVPAEEKAREFWAEAAGIESLPRLLLIGRDGVLRADCGPDALPDQITKLMAQEQAKGPKP
jgi:RNA polymerase sigma factor (sigma-70 family)